MTHETTPDVSAQVASVRRAAGLWVRDDYTLLVATGGDVVPWLHAQVTNDVMGLRSGQGNSNTLVDRKARLQAFFTLHRWENVFWILVERCQAGAIDGRVESHRFLEDVAIEDLGEGGGQVVLQGPRAESILQRCLDDSSQHLPADLYDCCPALVLGREVLIFRLSCTGEDGFVLVPPPGEAEALESDLLRAGEADGLQRIDPTAQEVLRVEFGQPRFGQDVDTDVVISETPLERTAVSYAKGCYLGQEVVTRLKTYGSPKQALMGLVFEAEVAPPPGPLTVGGKRVGRLTSSRFSPTLNALIGLAYLDRDHRTVDETLVFDDAPGLRARVVPLPFYEALDRRAHARRLFEEAMTAFEADAHDQDDRAIELLKEAVALQSDYEDAYEALGVILNRHHRVDEAIEYMQALERLRPDSVMAHANLSVFYLAKGLIAEAEEEKAKAALLEQHQKASAHDAERAAAAQRAQIEQEARGRIRMFEEVLEIDPEDPVATLGLGMAFMQLARYEEAIPPLQKATEVKKDYSAAFLNLGKCYEFLGNSEAAAAVYREGIQAASRKGDLMPLREMERRLKALESPRPE